MKDLKTLKNMIYQMTVILNKKQRLQMVGMFFVIFLGAMFELLGVTAMLPFIQAILTPEELMEKPYIKFFSSLFGIDNSNGVIVMVGIGIVIIYIMKNLYLSFSAYLQAAYSNNTNRQLSTYMLKAYMMRPYSFFVDNGYGVVSRGISADVQGVYNVISNFFKLLSEGFVIISVAIFLFVTDNVLAFGVILVGLISLVIIVFGLKKYLARLSSIYRKAAALQGKWAYQSVSGIKDIMVLNCREHFLKGYDNAYEDANKSNTMYTFACALPERIIEAFCISGIIITVLIRLGMGVEPVTFVPKLSVFAMGAFRLLPSISRSTAYINAFIYNRPMVEATYENIVAARTYQKKLSSIVSSDDEDTSLEFRDTISLKDVEWQYPQGKDKVLKGLNLEISKGQAIGIIGESGSGKSTLADLLLRLYKPQSGNIYMDGIDINTIPSVWSRVLSYVPQAVFLMDDTIRENVAFGDTNVDDIRIWKALRQASLEEFVKGLPDGLDTIVGERGVKFSGGQRQRIAIARALYINPQILILDEATSALDNETEVAVMEAIDSLAGSMTLIIIAHRVTTLKSCDKIYEIVDGKAIERNKDEVIKI